MCSLQDESGYQRDSCSVSRKSLGTSRIAVKSLGRVWESAEYMYILKEESGSSRTAVKSLGGVWIPTGLLLSLKKESGDQQDSC